MNSPPDPAPLPPTDEFLRAAEEAGIAFDAGDVERLGLFLALLLDANARFNLTAVTDPGQAWMRHIFDSLTLMPLLAAAGSERIADIGSGGGLPGIPLAIAMPYARFTLVEATGKKARFLSEAASKLALANVEVVNERAEVVGKDLERHRERYDAVLARAVGRLPVLLELTIPLARVGGLVMAVKGERAAEEIEEARESLRVLHAAVIDSHRTRTGTVVVIEKLDRTARTYPPAPGEPARAPISAPKPRP